MSPASVEHILNSIDIEKMSARTVWEKRQAEMRNTRSQSQHSLAKLTNNEKKLMNGAINKVVNQKDSEDDDYDSGPKEMLTHFAKNFQKIRKLSNAPQKSF